MSTDVTCDIFYDGLEDACTGKASFTLSHGVQPSTATIEVVHPTRQVRLANGALRIVQNGRNVANFKGCAIVDVFRVNAETNVYTVKIADRRWKWQIGGGTISGRYNVRRPDGTVIAETQKTAQELAKLCLDALGERGYDVSQLPNSFDPDYAPEVNWDYQRPVQALSELVGKLGCRVCLTDRDRIKVVVPGRGNRLPTRDTTAENSSVSNVAVPDSLDVICEQTIFQGLLELEEVSQEPDNTFVRCDDSVMKPDEKWEEYSPEYPDRAVTYGDTDEERKQNQMLVKRTVWRTFRIRGQAHGGLNVPGYRGTVSHRWQYQMLPELVDSETNEDGSATHLKPYVVGTYVDYSLPPESNQTLPSGNTYGDVRFPDDIQIDAANGLVRMPRAMYRLDEEDNYAFPRLWVYVAYHILHHEKRIADRYVYNHRLPVRPSDTKPQPLPVDGLRRIVKIKHQYNRNSEQWRLRGHSENTPEVDQEARKYARAKQEELEPDEGEDNSYAGFVSVSPDGAIQQVSWNLADGVGTTRASRNTEHSVYVPRYNDRNLMNQMRYVATETTRLGWRRG